MNTTISGATMRHSHRSGRVDDWGRGQGHYHCHKRNGHHDSNGNLPGVLSTLELRRLVAEMID